MIYDTKQKTLDGVELTRLEWQIIELLLEHKDIPLSGSKIADLICNKYYVTGINSSITNAESVSTVLCKLNKKFNKIIENKRSFGYRFVKEIEIL